jgi:exodeoxyribonuclease-5
MKWSTQQDGALRAVSQWLDAKDSQVFRLFGFAGTGKTTLARHFADELSGRVVFGAFTGKAALVMRSKGCKNASTIHSLIYTLEDEGDGAPTFALDRESDIKGAELVVIDECSMVDDDLARDLLSFKTPVLVLGDPEQLPPVKGAGFFTNGEPDFMLTDVHRQAQDNPIIRMSMDVREGRGLQLGDYGMSRVIRRHDVAQEDVMNAEQVLVGRNVTRRKYNERMRELRGFSGEMPQVGERLVCLRNNRKKGLLNGGLWTVAQVKKETRKDIQLVLDPEDAGGRKKSTKVTVRREFFLGTDADLTWPERRESAEFDFGYALTVHKSQGSQWNDVFLFNEANVFREEARRWLYTGITRAAERITVVM